MSAIVGLQAEALDIPFKVAFRHASASREAMRSLWVRARLAAGAVGVGEGCPREYVTGESLDGALAFVERHRAAWIRELDGVEALRRWIRTHADEVDANPAAWSAVELALLDAWAREAGVPLEALAGLAVPRGRFRYTAVIGDGPDEAFAAQLAHYGRAGFADFKVKLSGDARRDAVKVRALAVAGIPASRVRADANNLWRDTPTAIAALDALEYPFFALEEPLAAGDFDGMRRLADARGARVILDESFLRTAQLEGLATDAARWIVNIRVSKMGGLLRAAEAAAAARDLGTGIVVGAHVGETSVLTRAALAIATVAGNALIGQEGAFGTHLLERDPVTPCLMFGAGGVLEFDGWSAGSGLGLAEPGTVVDLRRG